MDPSVDEKLGRGLPIRRRRPSVSVVADATRWPGAVMASFDPHGSETPHNVDRTIAEIASTPRTANIRADVMPAKPRIWRT